MPAWMPDLYVYLQQSYTGSDEACFGPEEMKGPIGLRDLLRSHKPLLRVGDKGREKESSTGKLAHWERPGGSVRHIKSTRVVRLHTHSCKDRLQ